MFVRAEGGFDYVRAGDGMMRIRAVLRKADRSLTRLGVWITTGVGSMWCALLFVVIAVLATPGVFPAVTAIAVWVAQVLLQLVLLSVIMVGQNVQSARSEQLIRETHDAVMAELADVRALMAAAGVKEPDRD